MLLLWEKVGAHCLVGFEQIHLINLRKKALKLLQIKSIAKVKETSRYKRPKNARF